MSAQAELLAARPWLRMDALDGLLFEGVSLARVAAAHGTPCWVYGAATLRARTRALARALPGVALHYAVKANDHLAVLSVLAAEGAGADVVSGGELQRAVAAGMNPSRIVFSGVGKSAGELGFALQAGIAQINVESAEELEALAAVAVGLEITARVALRVNPDVDAGTHDKISTGRRGDKFGIPAEDIPALYAHGAALPWIEMRGLAVHIGSQIGAMAPYRDAYGRLAALVRELRGAGLAVAAVDCGGGLAYAYQDEPAVLPQAWAACVQAAFGDLDVALAVEPGRWIAAPAGVLLSRVVRSRRAGMVRPLHILDAAMNDLARPAMYGAWHGVVKLAPDGLHARPELADLAGPVCESSDFLARERWLPPLEADDLVAILDAGAYGAVMSSRYNARPPAAQVMLHDGAATLIKPRGTVEELYRGEMIPSFTLPA